MQESPDFSAARDHPEILAGDAAGPDHSKHINCYGNRNREHHAQCQTDLTGSMQEKIGQTIDQWLRLP